MEEESSLRVVLTRARVYERCGGCVRGESFFGLYMKNVVCFIYTYTYIDECSRVSDVSSPYGWPFLLLQYIVECSIV